MQENDPFETVNQLELNELSEAVRDEDARLIRSELSPLHDHIEDLARSVEDRSCVGLVVMDACDLGAWERQYGAAAFESLMNRLAHAVECMRGTAIRKDDVVCLDAPRGEAIVVFLSAPREYADGPTVDFENIVKRIKREFYDYFESSEWWFHQALERVSVGSAFIIRNDSVNPHREIYRAIRKAQIDAQVNHREAQRQRHRVVGHMIAQRKISTLYQPILSIQTGEIVGYEALSRAEPSDAQRLGVHLFVAAAKAELDGELDQTCRALSVRRRPILESSRKLFVNSLPPTFYEPMKDLEAILMAWESDGLLPEQLVFEITETITREQLNQILPSVRKLKKRGYQFAVDDVGTGTANLQLIADLDPDYIKMDITLTRGIAKSSRKQDLASYLLDLARRCDAELIAEGIEDDADRQVIVDLGVHLGQGFLLGRPEPFEGLTA